MTRLQLCALFNFQICGTFPPVFIYFFFQVEANPVQMRCQCFYSAVMANSKLDYYQLSNGRQKFGGQVSTFNMFNLCCRQGKLIPFPLSGFDVIGIKAREIAGDDIVTNGNEECSP